VGGVREVAGVRPLVQPLLHSNISAVPLADDMDISYPNIAIPGSDGRLISTGIVNPMAISSHVQYDYYYMFLASATHYPAPLA